MASFLPGIAFKNCYCAFVVVLVPHVTVAWSFLVFTVGKFSIAGTHMVFFILNVVEFLGLLMTFKPFLASPAHEYF